MKIAFIILAGFLAFGFQVQDSTKKTYTVSGVTLVVPSDADCKEMANNTIGTLADAIINKDFSEMYKTFIAKKWRENITQKQLADAFQSFIDNDIDLTMALHTKPKFTSAPAIDSLGVLNFGVEYATKPVKTVASMRFLQEKSNWKLCGLSVNLQ
jgi:hypothetical protein